MSRVERPPPQLLKSCVDMALSLGPGAQGHRNRQATLRRVYTQTSRAICGTGISQSCFNGLLPWTEDRAVEAFDDGRTMDDRALENVAELLYTRCRTEETTLLESTKTANSPAEPSMSQYSLRSANICLSRVSRCQSKCILGDEQGRFRSPAQSSTVLFVYVYVETCLPCS